MIAIKTKTFWCLDKIETCPSWVLEIFRKNNACTIWTESASIKKLIAFLDDHPGKSLFLRNRSMVKTKRETLFMKIRKMAHKQIGNCVPDW